MIEQEPIILTFTGGINNLDVPLNLFLRKQGECVNLVNADTTYLGRLKLLRPLSVVNSTAVSSIHSVFRANDTILVGAGTVLYYLSSSNVLTSLVTGLAGTTISFTHVGNWVFFADGTNKGAVYIGGTTPTACGWGQAVPTTAPTVASGIAGNPDGTYSCYYRYKITLPDGTIIRTGLSPVGSAVVSSEKIEWSDLVHVSFTGATTNQIELFRTMDSWSAIYLVTTLDDTDTTYSDNNDDATVQANTAFAETGYYPPPDSVDLVYYNPNSDRIFMTVSNNAYWTEAGKYHCLVYDTDAGAYTNVNSVYLSGENVTAVTLIDEQLYFGSPRTRTRLRGQSGPGLSLPFQTASSKWVTTGECGCSMGSRPTLF